MALTSKKEPPFFEVRAMTTGFHFSRGKPPGLWDRLGYQVRKPPFKYY